MFTVENIVCLISRNEAKFDFKIELNLKEKRETLTFYSSLLLM